jgi:hypothetical protein
MRRLFAVSIHSVSSSLPIPDVPFIEGEPQFLRRPLMSSYQIAYCERLGNLTVHGQIHHQIFGAISSRLCTGIAETMVE